MVWTRTAAAELPAGRGFFTDDIADLIPQPDFGPQLVDGLNGLSPDAGRKGVQEGEQPDPNQRAEDQCSG